MSMSAGDIETVLNSAERTVPPASRCSLSTEHGLCARAALARSPDGMAFIVCRRHFLVILGRLALPHRPDARRFDDADPERVRVRGRVFSAWKALHVGTASRADTEVLIRAETSTPPRSGAR